MSPPLVLQFLGLPQIFLDKTPVITDRRKAIALLAYLAVNDIGLARGKYSRESLSALLWPDYEQAKAFSNLRRTIWEIHQAIGEGWLIAERESIQLNPNAEINVDATRFQDLLSQARLMDDPGNRIPLLTECVQLYRNNFLTGFSIKDSYPFNEWAFAESEGYRRQLAEALTLLIKSYCTQNQPELALSHARRLVTLDPLNESAHRQLMEVYFQAGQHSAALKQYQVCEQILRQELGMDPQSETRDLYKRIRKREIKPVQVEKQNRESAPQHNLPLQLSSFIGREKEQKEILELLTKNRFVNLIGVGGMGKTRLALQVGQSLLNDYPDGVWFTPFDSLSNPMLVFQTVASIFDIQETADRSLIEKLTDFLHEKTTLLILDNCEHLLDACMSLITQLLQNCPNLKILVTSRETLNIAGEAIYSMPSLSVPEHQDEIEKYLAYESIRLFTDRARLALSSFSLTEENVSAVVEICRKVDGIPLAIELAAAHVNFLRVEEIWKQLQESFALLASDSKSILPRQQTLQASMDWSWGLLAKPEQIFLRQLAVFAGGWSLEAAQAVCDGDVLKLTGALVKKSLIVVDQAQGRETRYRFHEIVRQYVNGKPVWAGEEKIHTRHLSYFLSLAERATTEFVDPTWDWISRLNDERDNIRAALNWADKTDLESGLYLSGRLRRYWESSNVREGIHWLETFVNKSESKDFPLARARALHTIGWLVTWHQQFDKARSVTEDSLALFRAAGDLRGEADALVSLANIEQFFDEQEAAVALLQRSLDLSGSLNDSWREANAYYLLGWNPRDWQLRFRYWERAALLYRQTGDQVALANVLAVLGQFRVLNGDFELGEKYIDEALPLWESSRKANTWESPKVAKSSLALIRGEPEQAYILLEEALHSAREKGNRMSYLWARARLGYAALRTGRLEEARGMFIETARDFQKDRYTIGVVFVLEGMASLDITVGKPEHAARLIGWADAAREKVHDKRPVLEQADVDKIIAACLVKLGEVAFSDAYDEGQKMSLEEAVAFALGES